MLGLAGSQVSLISEPSASPGQVNPEALSKTSIQTKEPKVVAFEDDTQGFWPLHTLAHTGTHKEVNTHIHSPW